MTTLQLGSQVRSLREAAGISQQALGQGCGLSQAQISRIEAGVHAPGFLVMVAIAAMLGVPVERFAHADDPDPPAAP